MYRFLLTPRWIALTLLVVVLIPVMVELGFWQYHRHEGKVSRNDLISDNSKRPAVPVEKLMAPGTPLPKDGQWRPVTATGRFDGAHEVLVRQRTLDNVVGYHVVTPLILADGRAVLVNRGWVENPPRAVDRPDVPPPPAGEVTVTGRARPDETRDGSGIRDRRLPEGQVMRISAGDLAPGLPYPVLGGHVELTAQDPPSDPAPMLIPAPDDVDLGPHLAYAVQWWVFAAALVGIFIKMVRGEARELEEELAALEEQPEPASV